MQQDEQRKAFDDYSYKLVEKLFSQHEGKLDKLSEKEQEVVRIWRLEADMYNGGFLQYFCNWGYDNFLETQKILQQLGAVKCLQIITEYESTIAVVQDDERLTALWDIPKYLGDYLTVEQEQRLEELDNLYWDNPDDLQLLCYNYYLKPNE
ncbi:DMP19 family protein [Chitinophaga flava]|uniref:DNA mimic protein DMP19 C-terminal domain-containing protein n=1 Tax=Chitinophaga flava TaxID=2259036 RepID=A0A365Y3C3_9BACT|nr:DUF4375 domain-containing protein [Chitinophaga flava]RBL92375.1 hypothetical protein DF182_07245 [Chitinophaga flava]